MQPLRASARMVGSECSAVRHCSPCRALRSQPREILRAAEASFLKANGAFLDGALMRIPNAANRFRFAESGDLPQAVGFRNEVTVHHGSAMLGKYEKLGVRFDYR